MGRWNRTITIKDLLSGGTDAGAIKAAADGIIDRLPPGAPWGGLDKARSIADEDPETALLVFNNGLDRIYDWADKTGVWLA